MSRLGEFVWEGESEGGGFANFILIKVFDVALRMAGGRDGGNKG